jgi:uncharacterized membrane protein YebE (DUF533 family)
MLVPPVGAGALEPETAALLARALAEPRSLAELVTALDRAALRAEHA